MMTATTCLVRVIAFLTVILSITVLGICGWTLAMTIINEESEATESNYTSLATTANAGIRNNSHFVLEDEQSEGIKNSDDRHGMTKKFKYLIQACIGACICVTLGQLIIAMVVCCRFRKPNPGKLRLWQLSQFIILLLLLMCILVPLSYNREKDIFRGTISFGKYMKMEIVNFCKMILEQKQSIVTFFMTGLNAFYISVFANVFFLILFILTTCCTSCCCCCRCCCCRKGRSGNYGDGYS